MKKPTLNQRIWQSLIKEAQKALTQITKHTGEIFDESVFTIQQPKRVTQKAISRLRETELKFIRTKTEEVIHNLQPKEAEELTRKIRTREQYIRHPRISTTTERERHPLTPEERSARAKKAWKTRWERMTPEEQTEYRETFKTRMQKGKQAKELERQGLVPPPEDISELEQLTPEEEDEKWRNFQPNGEYQNIPAPDIRDIIDDRIEEEIENMYNDPDVYKHRIPPHKALFDEAKERMGVITENGVDYTPYYRFLLAWSNVILKLTENWLFASGDDNVEDYNPSYSNRQSPAQAFIELASIMKGTSLSLEDVQGYYTENKFYDPYER